MPIRSRVSTTNPTPSSSSVPERKPWQPAENPSLTSPSVFDDTEYDADRGKNRFQKLMNVLGTGTRAIGGWASNMGGLPGAAIGAGSEGLAQTFEGLGRIHEVPGAIKDISANLKDPNASPETQLAFMEGVKTPVARVGLEGALSAIPGSAVIKGGRAAQSAVRSGVLSGVGSAGRQYATTGEIDPGTTLAHAAFGGLIGGGLGKVLPDIPTAPAAPTRPTLPVKPPGPAPLTPQDAEAQGFSAAMSQGLPYKTSRGATVHPPSPRPMTQPTTGVPASKQELKQLERMFMSGQQQEAATRAAQMSRQTSIGKVMAKEIDAEQKAAQAAAENAAKLQQIEAEMAAQGLERGVPRVSESISAELPSGARQSMSTPWRAPEEEEGLEALGGAVPPSASVVRPIDPRAPVGNPPTYLGTQQGPNGVEHVYTDNSNKIFTGPPPSPSAPPSPDEAFAEALAMFGGKKKPSTPRGPRSSKPKTAAEFDAQARAMAGGPPEAPPPVGGMPVRPTPPPPAPAPAAPPVDPTLGKAAADVATGRVVPSAPVVSDSRLDALTKMLGGGSPVLDSTGKHVNIPPTVVMPTPPVSAPSVPTGVNLPGEMTPDISAATTPNPLVNFFKSRVDAMGAANRGIKAAKASGETVPEAGRAAVGKGLQQEAKAAGLPVGRGARAPIYGQPAPPPAGPPTVNADEIAAAAKAGRPIGASADEAQIKELQDFLKRHGKSETGAVDPLLATQIAGGAAGGLYGALPDEGEEGFDVGGALSGAAGGFALGSLPRIIGAGRDFDSTQLRETAYKIAERIPEIQRANYLASGPGIAANAVVGPIMSGVTSSIEAMLKGDERGMRALKEIIALRRGDISEAFTEAGEHIGRAETRALGEAPNAFDKATAFPGHLLTTGDVTIRNALRRAGFSDEEARIMTLTSEPGSAPDAGMVGKAAKAITNASRSGGPIINTLNPFVRTPMNILEQGISRTPGVGALYEFLRGNKSGWDIGVEQGMGLGISGAAYGLGAGLDPESARTLRRFVSNASGRYALPAGLAYSAGQASNQTNPNLAGTLARGVGNAIPLPTADIVEDWGQTINKLGDGEVDLPRGSYPAFLRELGSVLGVAGDDASATSELPSLLPRSGVRSRGSY